MSYVSQEEIFKATDGGLDIILAYYPQAANCVNTTKKFKLRDNEKTASATVKRMPDGNYVVTDFGGDGKPKNAIAVVMDEANCDFKTAIQLIADRWHILPEERKTELLKPKIAQRDANPDEEDGIWQFEHGDFTEKDFQVIFSDNVIKYVQECEGKDAKPDAWCSTLSKLCKQYYMHKLESYSVCKNRKVTTISSTEHYPIFVFEVQHNGKKIKKIYQPLSLDKGRRFIYYGGQPNDYIFGGEQAARRWNDLNKETEEKGEDDEPRKEVKIPEIILCTGGSDALNVAALGYQVVWLNSESAKLNGTEYYKLAAKCDKFCILPDIDSTGRRTAHELCMIYLDTRTIQLPAALADKRDWRGNACKDVRDYLKYWKRKDFDGLVKAALPYKFWDEVAQYDKKGKFTGMNYECNNTHLYWFLSQNGFYQYTNKNEIDQYIHLDGNIVKDIDAKKIRKFINNFLAERNVETKLRNTFFRTTQLNATSFENLPHTEIDFTDYSMDSQWLFFMNQTWEIKKNEIVKHKPGNVNKYVWEKEVINHRVDLMPDFFTIVQDEYGEWRLTIHNEDCIFFKFLMRTCKMHWKVEEYGVDDGQGGKRTTLNEDEKREEELHIINRLYALGYLLHKYKEPSSAFAVWAMENEVIENSDSEGRSGKSIFLKFPRILMKTEIIGARDQRITENKHMLENVNEFTDYVLFDDCNEYINFAFFFPLITGPWTINPKNTKSFMLGEDDAPKIAFSSNFSPKNADGSMMDRLIFTVFSDYYHYGPSEKFATRRTPKDDFGMNLFTDFDEKEWNATLNFGAQAIKFYLNVTEKINPPMNKVTQRQLLGEMGDVFKAWADVYFSVESGRLNSNTVKDDAQDDCLKKNNLKWTSQKFGKALKAWCKFYGFKLNPKELCNDKGRIIAKVGDTTKEMIHIQTTADMMVLRESLNNNESDEPVDKLPF
jgi:hypothetical protein